MGQKSVKSSVFSLLSRHYVDASGAWRAPNDDYIDESGAWRRPGDQYRDHSGGWRN